eukprot:3364683-Amphidinium_carterae.1
MSQKLVPCRDALPVVALLHSDQLEGDDYPFGVEHIIDNCDLLASGLCLYAIIQWLGSWDHSRNPQGSISDPPTIFRVYRPDSQVFPSSPCLCDDHGDRFVPIPPFAGPPGWVEITDVFVVTLSVSSWSTSFSWQSRRSIMLLAAFIVESFSGPTKTMT